MPSAQELRQKLLGAWSLVSWRTESDKGTQYPFGESPSGIIMYTPDGYMSAQLQKPGAPKYADSDLTGGTLEENAQAMKHYMAYSGKFKVEEKESEVHLFHNMFVSSFPNWLGDTQERICNIEGDLLTLSTEPIMTNRGMSKPILQWRRMEPNN